MTASTSKLGRSTGRLRTAVVDRVDALVLARMRTLTNRAGRGIERKSLQLSAVLGELASGGTPSPEVVNAVASITAGLWDREDGAVDRSPLLRQAIVDQFSRLYYQPGETTWQQTTYRGVTTWKCPLDMWVYQEIVHEVRPALIVETGTAYGGSALFLADLCETVGYGHVVTIDIRRRADDIEHDRLTKVVGSSIDEDIRNEVAGQSNDGPVLVVLDSDHRRDHVLAELRMWCDIVTPGSYVIVEDTNINGHPVFPRFGPGPGEAVAEFLIENDSFEVDRSREKYLLTWNPGGFLRRVR